MLALLQTHRGASQLPTTQAWDFREVVNSLSASSPRCSTLEGFATYHMSDLTTTNLTKYYTVALDIGRRWGTLSLLWLSQLSRSVMFFVNMKKLVICGRYKCRTEPKINSICIRYIKWCRMGYAVQKYFAIWELSARRHLNLIWAILEFHRCIDAVSRVSHSSSTLVV